MKKQFQIRTCPLCSKKLKIGDEDSTYTYYCEEYYLTWKSYSLFDFLANDNDDRDRHTGKIKEPHYAVDISKSVWTQSTIIPPYWIISKSDSDTTKIHKFNKSVESPSSENLLMEVPIIVPSDYLPEQFAKKIKNLVIFT